MKCGELVQVYRVWCHKLSRGRVVRVALGAKPRGLGERNDRHGAHEARARALED